MSRSCQSATFSRPASALPRSTRAQPGDALAEDRVALVRHRRGALLALAERLLDLAHLGALQVADLGRDLLEAAPMIASAAKSAAWRSRWMTWVETRLGPQAELAQTQRLDARVDVRVGADRAGELADGDARRAGAAARGARRTSASTAPA